jgi:hypothetical protein
MGNIGSVRYADKREYDHRIHRRHNSPDVPDALTALSTAGYITALAFLA